MHPFNATYTGELQIDDSFNMAATESQEYLLEMCEDLEGRTSFIIEGTVKCWIEDFKDFIEVNNGSFPVAEDDFMTQIESWVGTPSGNGHKAS